MIKKDSLADLRYLLSGCAKGNMNKVVLSTVLALSIVMVFPAAFAEPTVAIVMEKTTYSYCEKLFYTIEVSEVTGDPAIIHIRDEAGQGSSAIPISITNLQNPIPSLIPFEPEIFPLGKYFVDVKYSGAEATAEFTLIDSDFICIPSVIKPIMTNWLSGNISDGFLVDAFQKFVDDQLIDIPFEIDQENVYDIDIPEWVKNPMFWWLEGHLADDELANIVNYLVDKKIISTSTEAVPQI